MNNPVNKTSFDASVNVSDTSKSLISIKQAAHRLGITSNSLRIRIFRKTLPIRFDRCGGRIYFSRNDIDEFLNKGGWNAFAELRAKKG